MVHRSPVYFCIMIRDIEQISNPEPTPQYGLTDIHLSHMTTDNDFPRVETGERFEVSARLLQVPRNPYQLAYLDAWLVINGPDGEQRIPAFGLNVSVYRMLVMVSEQNQWLPVVCMPVSPGGSWYLYASGGSPASMHAPYTVSLPSVHVHGKPWADYARRLRLTLPVLSIADDTASFYWPPSVNIRSVADRRSASNMRTRVTLIRVSMVIKPT